MCEDKRPSAIHVADWKTWGCTICMTRNHQGEVCFKCGRVDPNQAQHIYTRIERLERGVQELEDKPLPRLVLGDTQ